MAPTGVKTKKVAYDFGTIPGLIEALKSPVVSARDAARRGLIACGPDAVGAILRAVKPADVPFMARTMWVNADIPGSDMLTSLARAMAEKAPNFGKLDPRIREQAIRILGRDVSRDGHVELADPQARKPLTAEANLPALLATVDDPDAGVRRELILAFRDMPTEKVGEALKTLCKSWDGKDRWYLEALGLALKNREPAFLKELFDGNLYGDLDLDNTGKLGNLALPPYFPVDRNEAFISASDPDLPPANALTKTLGLAWMVHKPEVLPIIARVMPKLYAPEIQQAADDVIQQISGSSGAVTLADLAMTTTDMARRRQILGILAKKLDGSWREAQGDTKVSQAIEMALRDPETKTQGIQMAGVTGNAKYADALGSEIENPKAPEEVKASAVEALARLRTPKAKTVLEDLIAKATAAKASSPAAEAAVRSLPRLGNAREKLMQLMNSDETPLGLRREALRTLATQNDGARMLLAMATEKKLPDSLKTEAATVLRGHPDGGIRNAALRAMPIVSASGRPLPSNGELIRRDGQADRGREVFFKGGTTTCASCHRVQGRGQWVGPDLSTIGSKYGKDELLRSILNPSAAIGYNYRSLVVAQNDGQVITGLMVEDTPEKLVLKTSEGKRVTLRPTEIEARKMAEISLMPEGLAQAMQEQDLVNLLTYLTTLKQPVSIVGQFSVLGPVGDSLDRKLMDPTVKIDPKAPMEGEGGKLLQWRRLSANAEGLVDMIPLLGTDASKAGYLLTPVTSPVDQEVRVVLDTKADIKAWLGGKPLDLPVASEGEPRATTVKLPAGTTELVIRMPGGNAASLVATFVANRPIEFSPSEAK